MHLQKTRARRRPLGRDDQPRLIRQRLGLGDVSDGAQSDAVEGRRRRKASPEPRPPDVGVGARLIDTPVAPALDSRCSGKRFRCVRESPPTPRSRTVLRPPGRDLRRWPRHRRGDSSPARVGGSRHSSRGSIDGRDHCRGFIDHGVGRPGLGACRRRGGARTGRCCRRCCESALGHRRRARELCRHRPRLPVPRFPRRRVAARDRRQPHGSVHDGAARRTTDGRGGRGTIVHVSSIDAYGADGNQVAYNASKAGMLGLSRTMAVELARTASARTSSHPDTQPRR